MTDETYMKLALDSAQKGCGWVNPNPMVGAVIVKNSRIIGAGYHEQYGALHAERNALAACTEPPQGATLYVTLEPCCHFGKTPPCTDAILASGIKRVVIGSPDPNPLVARKGVETLRQNGIQVTEGILLQECHKLNEVFFHFIQHQTPYVVMKYAMTMDGKIATHLGESKWITGEVAREHVQKGRHRYMGILVGVGTILKDNPSLTCRLPHSKSPIRIICDTHLKTPLEAQVIQTAKIYPTLLATCCTDQAKTSPYLAAGCEVLVVSEEAAHIALKELLLLLGQKGIDSLLLEGGNTLNGAFLEKGLVNKVQAYLAPKLFGGTTAKSPIGGLGVKYPDEAVKLSPPEVTLLGEDILLESEVLPCSQVLLKK